MAKLTRLFVVKKERSVVISDRSNKALEPSAVSMPQMALRGQHSIATRRFILAVGRFASGKQFISSSQGRCYPKLKEEK
jgi:hypothetical protein